MALSTGRCFPSLFVALALGALPPAVRADAAFASPEDEDRFAERLRSDPVRVVRDDGAGGGVTGARKLTLRFSDGEDLDVKWKPVPDGMDGWNNSPRKEIAAYAVQRLFLDPPDFVVPTTVLRCLPPDAFRPLGDNPKPNVRGAQCVLGVLEEWLHDVHPPQHVYDPKLFQRDPVYARHMADLNLFTYLIEHQDGRSSNFLMSNDPAQRRVFSIDNGIAFGASIHNFFVRNWSEIRIPALRRDAVERLRAQPRAALDALAVVAEMRRDAGGVLRPVPPGASRAPDRGLHLDDGTLQLGLRRAEIEALEARLRTLLEEVDAGERETF